MKSAIITGTGIYEIPGFDLEKKTIDTPYGPALVNIARKGDIELVYLARHGLDHSTPPHNIKLSCEHEGFADVRRKACHCNLCGRLNQP